MKNKALILVIFLASFLRLFWLDRMPPGSVRDGANNNPSKSIYLWYPHSLIAPSLRFSPAENTSTPLSPFYSKLPYALVSIWLVVCVYLVTETLIGPQVALIAGIVAAINPWLIYFGRSAYDTPVAITAMVSGLYILLVARGWKILWSFPLFMAGFYGYTGATSLLVLSFVALSAGYAWHVVHKRAYTLQYVLLFVLCLTCFGRYAWQGMHSTAGIGGQLSTPYRLEIAQITDTTRKLSIQSPLLPIIVNKYTQFIRISAEKYTRAFSADFLFLRGDSTAQFAVREHGVLYLLDAVFLLVGIGVLYSSKRAVWYLCIAILSIAPIPSVLSIVGTSYAIRSMLMAPVLCMLIAVGIDECIRNNPIRATIVAVLYALSLSNFLYICAYRIPVYASDSYSRRGRIPAPYISLADAPVHTVHSDSWVPLKQYLVYTDCLAKQTPKMYKIASDRMCGLIDLKQYPEEIRLGSINIERLTRMAFYQAYIAKY